MEDAQTMCRKGSGQGFISLGSRCHMTLKVVTIFEEIDVIYCRV